MERKLIRNFSLGVAVRFLAVLIALIAMAALAQTRGTGQPSGKESVLAPPVGIVPAQTEHPFIPWADGARRVPASHSHMKRSGPIPMDSEPPLFLPAVSYDSAPGGAMSVAVGDVNLDGKPDLVVANQSPATVSVLLGNGDGTFQAAMTYDSGAGAGGISESVAVADLNGDGKPDLVVGSDTVYGPAVGALLGNGDGTFQPAFTYPGLGFWSVAVADVNSDGKPDVIADSQFGNDVAVALGNGDGTFQSPVSYGAGGTYPMGVAIADVNGDGRPDLLVANWWVGWPNTEGTVGVLLGNGDGTFQPAVVYDSGGTTAYSVAVGDLNGDGKPDMVVTNYGSQTVGVLFGNGDGMFQPVVTYYAGGGDPTSAAFADADGDGKLDVLVANVNTGGDGTVGVLLGNGDGTLQPVVTYDTGGSGGLSQGLAVADLNGDRKPDLAVANFGNSAVGVLLHTSGPAPTTTTLFSSQNPVARGKLVTYTATVTSQNGRTVTGTAALQDGGVTVATVPVANNQASYSTTYKKGGVHAMMAVYSGDANNAGSTSATLMEYVASYASETKLTSSGSPSYVGQPVTFTATVTSKHGVIPDGELVTFYRWKTHQLASVALVGGVATYTTSFSTPWRYAIKAVYPGDAEFAPSVGSMVQTVQKYSTTTTLSSSQNPSQYGQPVTFTMTVSSDGGPVPTGWVTLRDGLKVLASPSLSDGTASFTTSTLTRRRHRLRAIYGGDQYSRVSRSPYLQQVVE